MFYKACSAAILFFCYAAAVAQQPPTENQTPEARDGLRKEAVAFLRETLTDVGSMRSLENRISFTAELAELMWFHDEREARSMYGGVIGDFRDLLARYDADMNRLGITIEEKENRGPMPSFLVEPTDRSRVMRRFTTAMGVRQQIAASIAEHDPDLAFNFYHDSLAAISNPEFRKQAERDSSQFEAQLLGRIAAKDAAKAAQLGARSVSKGLSFQHLELLKTIHAKDPEKGAEFGAAILSRLKSEKLDSGNFYMARSLIEFGEETLASSRKPGGKRAVYSQSELRDMAELLAQAILAKPSGDEDEYDYDNGLAYVEVIQRYSPSRAAQIRARAKTRGASSNANVAYGYGVSNAASAPPPAARGYASNANSNAAYGDPATAAREAEERQLAEDVKKLDKRELPKEEREKIIGQARRIIMQTPGRDKKVMALSALASQVAKFGDKELAAEIMKDAEALVNPSPKTYQDFMLSWLLASGYAASDPDRAFPILEDTIGRANETLSAFIKVGEFIDVGEEMIQDGEVQVGAFGGQMVRGLTGSLGVADQTIQVLAHADFAKTGSLTNRFDRAEIRILAKMMVLRAILNPAKAAKTDEVTDRPMDIDSDQ